MSIPSIGALTALIMLIDMPELGTMDAKQIASLAGLAPLTRQSGHRTGKSFIQGGRAQLRQALYRPPSSPSASIYHSSKVPGAASGQKTSKSRNRRHLAQAAHHRKCIAAR